MCHGSTPANNQAEKALALCELCSGSHKHISVLETLFSAQFQNTASHQSLWRKLTLPHPNPAHSAIWPFEFSAWLTPNLWSMDFEYIWLAAFLNGVGFLRTRWQIISPSDSAASGRLPLSSVSRQTASVPYGKRLWVALRTFGIP